MALVAAWWGIWDIIAGLVGRRQVGAGPPARRPRRPGAGCGMTRVLVTGGSGFLGRSVGRRGLTAAGHEVVSADLRPPAVVMDVTSAVAGRRAVDRRACDRRSSSTSASIVTPGPDSTRELEYAVDVDGTRHVLDACVAHGVRRVVVSSSGAAYGYHADNPAWITEDQPVRGNEEFAYSHHKRLVEEMLGVPTAPRWSRWCCGSAPSSALASTTRSPRCSSARGC